MPNTFSRLVRSCDQFWGLPGYSLGTGRAGDGSFARGTYSYAGNAKHGLAAFTLDAYFLGEENRTLNIYRIADGNISETDIKRSGFPEMAQWMSAADYERLFSVNDLRQKDLVVDVACGSGEFVHKSIAEGINMEGVDLVLSAGQACQPFFKQGTAWTLPYATGAVSVIYETWGPTWLQEFKRLGHWASSDVFAEYRRVLSPGGLIRLGPVPLEKITPIVSEVSELRIRYAAPMDYAPCVYLEIQKA